jgi:hypothetical protein
VATERRNMPKTSVEHLRELEDELDAIEQHLAATDSFVRIAGDLWIRRNEIRAIHAILPEGLPPSETSSKESSPPAKKGQPSSQHPVGAVRVWALGDWLEVSRSRWTEVIALLGEEEAEKVSTEGAVE